MNYSLNQFALRRLRKGLVHFSVLPQENLTKQIGIAQIEHFLNDNKSVTHLIYMAIFAFNIRSYLLFELRNSL